jgi:hypothetical protein
LDLPLEKEEMPMAPRPATESNGYAVTGVRDSDA